MHCWRFYLHDFNGFYRQFLWNSIPTQSQSLFLCLSLTQSQETHSYGKWLFHYTQARSTSIKMYNLKLNIKCVFFFTKILLKTRKEEEDGRGNEKTWNIFVDIKEFLLILIDVAFCMFVVFINHNRHIHMVLNQIIQTFCYSCSVQFSWGIKMENLFDSICVYINSLMSGVAYATTWLYQKYMLTIYIIYIFTKQTNDHFYN